MPVLRSKFPLIALFRKFGEVALPPPDR